MSLRKTYEKLTKVTNVTNNLQIVENFIPLAYHSQAVWFDKKTITGCYLVLPLANHGKRFSVNLLQKFVDLTTNSFKMLSNKAVKGGNLLHFFVNLLHPKTVNRFVEICHGRVCGGVKEVE